MRAPQSFAVRVHTHVLDNRSHFIFQVRDNNDRPLNGMIGRAQFLSSDAVSHTDAGVDVRWNQTGPGEYEASVALPQSKDVKTISFALEAADGAAIHYCALVSGIQGGEMAETGPDLAAAQSIASAGGGIMSEDPSAIAAACSKSHAQVLTVQQVLWPWLIMAAIVLWPFDLLVRKVL